MFIFFNALVYSNAQMSQSAMVARWMNYQILSGEVEGSVKLSPGGKFCRSIDLSHVNSGELYGECKIFTIGGSVSDCFLWWLGRMCLHLATTADLYESDFIKGEFFRLSSSICAETSEFYIANLCDNIILSKPIYLSVYEFNEQKMKLDRLVTQNAEKANME